MKRLLIAVGLAALWCWWTRHTPKRQPVGGYRCASCKRAFADLEDAGALDEVHVARTRAYSRENGGTFMRGDRWRADVDDLRKAGM